jgi:Xaa-Pro dipeptidase
MRNESNIFAIRQAQLQQTMLDANIQGFIVNQQVDMYYYNGSMQTGMLFIPVAGEAIFFVRRSVDRAKEESYARVEPMPSFKNFRERLLDNVPEIFKSSKEGKSINPIRFATELDVLPVQIYQKLQSSMPDIQWVDGSSMVREQRMIKSIDELQSIRKAAQLVNDTLNEVKKYVQVGMTEIELMAYIEYQLRKNGHLGTMRMRAYNSELLTGLVAAGASAATPTYFDGPAGGKGLHPASPQGSSQAAINKGEPLLIDIGCCIDGYLIDQTRTLVIGELNSKMQHAYDVSEHILHSIEKQLKPGVICEHLYLTAIELADKAGLSDNFMGYRQDQVKFLGHGIGLEIDELPILAKGHSYPLQSGMVIAIEPKFTFPQEGVVGIENTYLITKEGYEQLTISQEGIIYISS